MSILRRTRYTVFIPMLIVLVLIQLASLGCQSKSEADLAIEEVQNEIRDLFTRFKNALETDDLEQLFDTSSRESVKRMLFEAIVAMGSTAKSPKSDLILARYINQEKLTQIFKALQNPNEQQIMELYMVCIEKPRDMFIESYLYLREFEPNRPKPEFGSLSGIKVTGDVAIAETTVKTSPANIKAGKTNDQAQAAVETTVYFLRVNGKWLYATEAEWAGIVPREQSR